MDRSGTWGNTEEVLGLSHLLNTPVYSYVPSTYNWTRLSPDVVDLTQHAPITQKSIFIQNQHMHFTVIMSTLPYNKCSCDGCDSVEKLLTVFTSLLFTIGYGDLY